ncbi:MAG: hypothetical protein WAX77_12620 [Methylococcaceae bacterium]
MKTKNNCLLISLAILSLLLASCAQLNPHAMDMSQSIQNAKSYSDHDALAKHYEEVAKEMQAKADEHKNLLEQYQAKSYLYGKQAQTFKSHCEALIHAYQQATEANMNMANAHKQMALDAK